MEEDAARWDELQVLYHRVADLPPAAAAAALAGSGADPWLISRVQQLLADEPADAAVADHGSTVAAPGATLPTGFGPYRLLRRIGSGGVGVVYLAEREVGRVTLRSALKVLAPHAVDSTFAERFAREQSHLAALDHPNITRLLDAGWSDDGAPYLVMEFVDGVTIERYCDGRRLGVRERLRLFLSVCEAVSYAHRQLIVHLDLKPSNILVTTSGQVKLLDFGTSRLLQSDRSATMTLMATPAYASPEQLLNLPVSTASDVYGLGATLFELLAGVPPHGRPSSLVRMEAAVRRVEPQLLGALVTDAAAAARSMTGDRLRSTLAGDLSQIVARALRHDPAERYPSVDALAQDVRRYLQYQPVSARRPTLAYRMSKFARRNPWPIAIAVVVTAVVGGSLLYAWRGQQQALREARRSVETQTFMYRLFGLANPELTGKPVTTVREMLAIGMKELPTYIRNAADQRAARLALAKDMFDSGDATGAAAGLDDVVAEARSSGDVSVLCEALAYQARIGFDGGDIDRGRALASQALALSASGSVAHRARLVAEVTYAFNEDNNGYRTDANLVLLRKAIEQANSPEISSRDRAFVLHQLAMDLYLRQQIGEARQIFTRLLAAYESDPLALCDRSEAYGWIAWITDTEGDPQGSLALFEKSYQGYRACQGADSRGALEQLPYWADALIRTGQAPRAVAMMEAAMPQWRRQYGDSSDLSDMLLFLGRAYLAVGRSADAERAARQLLALIAGRLAPDSRDVGNANLLLGEALCRQRRCAEARQTAAVAQAVLSRQAQSPRARELAAEAAALQAAVTVSSRR